MCWGGARRGGRQRDRWRVDKRSTSGGRTAVLVRIMGSRANSKATRVGISLDHVTPGSKDDTSTSAPSSANCLNTTMIAGPCWNGNAASRVPTREPEKAHHSLKHISSKPQKSHLTILPAAQQMKPATAKCWAWSNYSGGG